MRHSALQSQLRPPAPLLPHVCPPVKCRREDEAQLAKWEAGRGRGTTQGPSQCCAGLLASVGTATPAARPCGQASPPLTLTPNSSPLGKASEHPGPSGGQSPHRPNGSRCPSSAAATVARTMEQQSGRRGRPKRNLSIMRFHNDLKEQYRT